MALPVLECIDFVSDVGWPWLALVGVGGRWLALVGAPPPLTPEKTALHTKSAQTAGLEAIWCEVPRKILRNTPV
ncbi:nucleosidase [Corynebacterium diphtheriae]|nr:nucleosidase [Corynebacterium diphtheriae]CAB0577239.1 nucleosidase [Corynebacterium diphtheriae]